MSDEEVPSAPETVWVKSEPCVCAVCGLLLMPFSALSFQAKRRLFSDGRPTPDLNLSQANKSYTRHFQREYYERHKWLTACPTKTRLFCWPCLMFGSEKTPWNKDGCKDLNNLPKLIKRHVTNRSHISALIKEKTFGKTGRHAGQNSSVELSISPEEHNKLVKNNREIFRRFIDVTCFLAQHGMISPEHDSSPDSPFVEYYKDLVDLIAQYDTLLKSYLQMSELQYSDSQNDLIQSMGNVVLKRIQKELKETSFVAIILIETSDINQTGHLSAILRYFLKSGEVKERFVGFLQGTMTDRTASALYEEVKSTMDRFKCGDKLIAQSYDGAVVTSAELEKLRDRVKQTYPNAIFTHCSTHSLKLVLEQSVSRFKDCKVFFSAFDLFASFYPRLDPTRRRFRTLDDVENASTRWNQDGKLVVAINECRESLIVLFENMSRGAGNQDSETTAPYVRFMKLLKTDLNFNFLLKLFSRIFLICDDLAPVIQSKTSDIQSCIPDIDDVMANMAALGDSFEEVWSEVSDLDLKPSLKRIRLDNAGEDEASYRQLYSDIVNTIKDQINERFGNLAELRFLELTKFEDNSETNQIAFECLKQNYDKFFDKQLLESQLYAIYNSKSVFNKSGITEMWRSLNEFGLDEVCSEVNKLCELALTVPGPTAFAECSCPAFKRIQSYTKNSNCQDKLSYSSLLSIEKSLIREMRKESNFYEEVTDDFAEIDRGLPLQYVKLTQ